MNVHPVFSVTEAPCGRTVYETDLTDWAGAGWPHPFMNDVSYPGGLVCHVVREDDPGNRYGVMYYIATLPDGTFLRILND